MKKLLLFPVIAIVAIAACHKPDAAKPTGCTQGTLKFVNDSAYYFAIYLDSIYQLDMPPHSTYNFTLDTGIQHFNTIQTSGSRIYANIEERGLMINGCDTTVYNVY